MEKLRLWSLVVLLALIPAVSAQAPYPDSEFNITWHEDTLVQKAPGSDLWPNTWAADGNIYLSWGDGGGFGGTDNDGRVAMGFARLEGGPTNFTATNVNGGVDPEHPASYPSPESGTGGGKTAGMISVNGTIYTWMNMQNRPHPNWDMKLIWSDDLGATWNEAAWKFSGDDGEFKPFSFVNYGKDRTLPDGYIYFTGVNVGEGGKAYIGRVKKDQIKDRSKYQYFAGTDSQGSATWGSYSERKPYFEDPNGQRGGTIVYNKGLDRYFLMGSRGVAENIGEGSAGRVGVFEAPNPWGPWETVAYYDNWLGISGGCGLVYGFVPKWISDNGFTMWNIFSHHCDASSKYHDTFNLIKATLTHDDASPTANAGSDIAVTDDGDGTETVTLDGSGSTDPDGTITEYSWSKDGSEIASGKTVSVDLPVGTHAVSLTVADDEGGTSSDNVTVRVEPAQDYAEPLDSFTVDAGSIRLNDTVIYKQGYYRRNGMWEPFTFSDEQPEWLVGGAEASVEMQGVTAVAAYSCSWENSWDCHGDWQVKELSQDAVCGNGVVESGEECDDGNAVSGDGCSSSCMVEESEESFGSRDAVLWEYEEWSVENPSYSGNPLDVVATVTFEHQGSSKTHTTEMFYAGGDTWKFRFTGTRTGEWNFQTASDDPELDGLTGSVSVESNPDRDGFVTHQGNKFAVQTGNTKTQGYVFNVYMNREDNPQHIHQFDSPRADTEAYCNEAKRNGFEIIFVYVSHDFFDLGARTYEDHDSTNPDLQTFDRLDKIVTTARDNGCRVMFWAWGDEERKMTTIGMPGGINGDVDRRLQRYIAARLGPIPGWSMGYGFDLHEYISKDELRSWQSYLHDKLGWQHLLSARSTDLQDPYNINGYAITDTEQGDFYGPAYPSKDEIIDHLQSDTDNPHLYEERHAWKRWGLNEAQTRRLVWRTAMAGGMGGWYGFYPQPSDYSDGPPYPDSIQTAFRTHHEFWHGHDRFTLDLERANDITNGMALTDRNGRYIVYAEDTDSVSVDLSGMEDTGTVVAVDTLRGYNERDLGTVEPGQHEFDLPRSSDWVIAVTDR